VKIGNSEIRLKKVDRPSPFLFALVIFFLISGLHTSALANNPTFNTQHPTSNDTLHPVPGPRNLTVSEIINKAFTPVVDVMKQVSESKISPR
jgi:hypothetical protein